METNNEKQDHKNTTGIRHLLAGIVLGAALVGAVWAGVAVLEGRFSPVSVSESEQSKEPILNEQQEKKLETIQLLLDKYYLYRDDVDEDHIADSIYKGYVSAMGDPYTVYYDNEEASELEESVEGYYSGLGALLSQDHDTKYITVLRCFDDSPAMEGGLLPGDVIVKVDQEDISQEDINVAVSKIKGPEGTSVTLTIAREGENDYIEKTFTRRIINVPTVESEVLDGDIGYMLISSFDELTSKQMDQQMENLTSQNIKGLVIDLRDNPGGVVDAVVDMCGQFIPNGLIVYTMDRDGNREDYYSKTDESEIFDKPVVVLVNQNSASASEIMAGALQDTGKATIVGTKTFGKGIVQQVMNLGDGTALKFTICKYFTPAGNDIHGVGITPQVEVDLDESLYQKASYTKEEDNQLQKGLEVLRQKIDEK